MPAAALSMIFAALAVPLDARAAQPNERMDCTVRDVRSGKAYGIYESVGLGRQGKALADPVLYPTPEAGREYRLRAHATRLRDGRVELRAVGRFWLEGRRQSHEAGAVFPGDHQEFEVFLGLAEAGAPIQAGKSGFRVACRLRHP